MNWTFGAKLIEKQKRKKPIFHKTFIVLPLTEKCSSERWDESKRKKKRIE